MGILAIIVLPMWLCSLCFQGTNGIRLHGWPLRPDGEITNKGNNTALNIIATDVVNDVLRVLIPQAAEHDEKVGPPKTRPLYSEIDIAGIAFSVTSGLGRFEGFSSLETTGRTNVSYVLRDPSRERKHPYYISFHLLIVEIPVTFKNFSVHYANVTISNGNQTWHGSLSQRVKQNNFVIEYAIKHRGGRCTSWVQGVRLLKDADADLDVKIEGLGELKLNHLALSRDSNIHVKTVVEDALYDYMTSKILNNNGILGYCKVQPLERIIPA